MDSSVCLAWCFEDECTPGVDAVLDRVTRDGAIAPPLWRYEVANGLAMAQRRQRIRPDLRLQLLDALDRLGILLDAQSDHMAFGPTARLADHYRLTIYDAAYLELAQRRGLPLATLDAELAVAARAAGVEVWPG